MDIVGMSVADYVGWGAVTMLELLSRFIREHGLEDECIAFLHEVADKEQDGDHGQRCDDE